MTVFRRFLLAALPALAAAGCSSLETLPLVSDLPKVPVPEALRIEKPLDAPRTLVERALSGCDKRTEAGEAACVKAALADGAVTVPALAAMLPGCRTGQLCHLTYTTEDQIGLFKGTASHYVARWRVEVDLRKPAASAGAAPVTVTQV